MEALERRVVELERELVRRDVLIRQLRADLDKCHQVMKPLRPPEPVAVDVAKMAELAPWRLGGLELPRVKRLAISAEPLLPRSMGNASAAEVLRQFSLQPHRRQPKNAQ